MPDPDGLDKDLASTQYQDLPAQAGELDQTERDPYATALPSEIAERVTGDGRPYQDTVEDIYATRLGETPSTIPLASDSISTRFHPSSATKSSPSRPSGRSRYQPLRLHARGGLGEIFVAVDDELNREVALKEIQERHVDHAESQFRFVFEAEVTGGLEHPGIVPVYGLGRYPDGRPYYAMRFIRGESLKTAIKSFQKLVEKNHSSFRYLMEFRNLLGRFIAVCHAIDYAHGRGVLHRDIKPDNIMLGSHGETLVVDWGLAKAMDRPDPVDESTPKPLRPLSGNDTSATMDGSVMGTPAFMSPEQHRGRSNASGRHRISSASGRPSTPS